MKDVSGNGEPKPVLHFEGKDKGMVLNKTNANKIAEIFGDDTDSWAGGQIVYTKQWFPFQGNTVPAIRVRVAPNKAQQKVQQSTSEIIDDNIPF
jgi:hypothetical protein